MNYLDSVVSGYHKNMIKAHKPMIKVWNVR